MDCPPAVRLPVRLMDEFVMRLREQGDEAAMMQFEEMLAAED